MIQDVLTEEENKRSLQQIVAQAQATLLELAQSQASTAARLVAIDSELASLASRAQSRATSRATAEATLSKLRDDVATLRMQAKLSGGTRVHGQMATQLREIERILKATEKQTTKSETEMKAEEDTDQARESALILERQQCEMDSIRFAEQHAATQRAHELAHRDLGEQEFRDTLITVELQRARVEQVQRALQAEQEALKRIVQDGVDDLRAWPEHAHQVQRSIVYEDARTAMLEAAIRFFEALRNAGRNAEIETSLLHRVWRTGSVMDLFMLNARDLGAILVGEDHTILERKGQLERLLQLYRQSKQSK